jgi:hypothetical protein
LDRQKKKNAETESSLSRQVSEAGKAKAVDEQKIEYLEKKLMESESKRQT